MIVAHARIACDAAIFEHNHVPSSATMGLIFVRPEKCFIGRFWVTITDLHIKCATVVERDHFTLRKTRTIRIESHTAQSDITSTLDVKRETRITTNESGTIAIDDEIFMIDQG